MYIIFYNTYMLLIVLHLVYIFSTESFTILYRIYYYYYIITTLLYIYPKYYTRFIILLIIFSQRRSHEQINDRVMLGARSYSKGHHYGSFRVSSTSSKFSKTKIVVALPWKVTDPCTISVIHSCPEKDAAIFAENGVAGLCAAILSYYRFIWWNKEKSEIYSLLYKKILKKNLIFWMLFLIYSQ